ncbi:MAG: glycoside hydrolase [Acidobacteriia bacterium]|nr:glycoside hydrolase [Terriglobia bacterium]
MRATLFVCSMISLAAGLAAQDPSTVNYSRNSISPLLAEKAPQLQDGYASADDVWMLYDWRFDLLSNGAQQFLLKKYGYLDFEVDGLDSADHSSGNSGAQAVLRARQAASAVATPAPGANIPVSQAFFRVGRRLQSETTIAVSGANILVGFNDGDLRGQAVAFSSDSGASWSGGRLPSYPGVVGNSGDPVLAVAPDGRMYHAYLAATAVGFLTVALAYSADGGATWTGPVNATASLDGLSSSLDKPWMTVDNIAGSPYRGNIYVTCTRFVSSGQDSISFMRSTDGGKTFSQAIALTTISASEAAAIQDVQGSFIAIGPGGETYVSWYDTRVNGIRLAKSTDGGVTFSDPVTALAGIGFGSSYYVPGTFDVAAFGQIAVDTSSGPHRGAVYVTTNVLNPGRYDLDIMLAHSGNGGTTWDPPVQVNNDKTFTSQFQPSLAVATNGNVGVAFYDRRNDPNDVLTDLYLAISSDGGKSFPTQQRVTTESWLTLPTPIGYRTGYHGDYNQIVASGGNFYLSWADDRDGVDPSVFMAMIPVSGGLPDFTLTAAKPFADILPGDTATFSLAAGASGVKLSATVYPASGIMAQATGATVTAASTAATAPGTYTITVTGDNGTIQRSTEIRVTVHPSQLGRAPTPITPTADPSYNSHSVIDSKGNLHVVFSGSVIGRRPKRITYLQIPPNGAPLAPVTLYVANVNSIVDTVQDPHVAVSPDGRIYVAWRYSDANVDLIMMIVSTDNGKTFSAPADISSQTETISGLQTRVHAFQPSIAVGTNGAVFVSFLRENLTRDLPTLPGVLVALRIDVAVIYSRDGGSSFSNVAVPTRYSSTPAPSLSTGRPPPWLWIRATTPTWSGQPA